MLLSFNRLRHIDLIWGPSVHFDLSTLLIIWIDTAQALVSKHGHSSLNFSSESTATESVQNAHRAANEDTRHKYGCDHARHSDWRRNDLVQSFRRNHRDIKFQIVRCCTRIIKLQHRLCTIRGSLINTCFILCLLIRFKFKTLQFNEAKCWDRVRFLVGLQTDERVLTRVREDGTTIGGLYFTTLEYVVCIGHCFQVGGPVCIIRELKCLEERRWEWYIPGLAGCFAAHMRQLVVLSVVHVAQD